jgi:hypothetical protein
MALRGLVAAAHRNKLNERRRKRFDFPNPTEQLSKLLLQ